MTRLTKKDLQEEIDDLNLLIRALRCGVCSFYQPTGELRFNGLLYSTRVNDFSRVLDVMDRNELTKAIIEAECKS